MKVYPPTTGAAKSWRPAWLAACGLLATALGLAVIDSPASAYPDTNANLPDLNTAFRKEAPKILKELNARGYKNVGVLKFQVKVNTRKATMHSARLNQQMATRLENALILANKPSSPVGVTRNASTAAQAKSRSATFLDQKGRAQLFNFSYPLAWGKTSTKVDAFLTGIVQLDSHADIAHVAVHVFDKKNTAKPEMVAHFKAKLTSSLVAESGQRFVVKKRQAVDPSGNPTTTDDPTIPENPTTTTPVDNDLAKVLSFKMYYDGMEVALKPGSGGNFECDPPPLTTKKIIYKVQSSQRVGMVLFVNGLNTLKMARADSGDVQQHYRWILEPGKEYTIGGFYPSFEKVYPFRVIPESEAATNPGDLGPEDKWGLIELTIFKDAGGGGGATNTDPPSDSNLQNPSPDPGTGGTAPDLELRSLQTALAKVNKTKPRNLMVPDKAGEQGTKVEEVTFNGVILGGYSITYFKKGSGGGTGGGGTTNPDPEP